MNILLYILVIFIIFYVDKKITVVNSEKLLDNIKNKKIDIKKLIVYSSFFTFFILFIYYLLIYLKVINNVNESFFDFKFITVMLSTIFVSPFIEEYIFRFLPYKYYNKNNLKYFFIILSSVIFTFIHKVNGIEYLLVFISSLMLSFIMFKSNKFIYNYSSHAFYNFVLVLNKFLVDEVNLYLLVIYGFMLIISSFLVIFGNKK